MIKEYDDIKADDLLNLKIEYNYHSHNYLCGHATGTVCDYVKVAVENGLKSIGISDHFAHPALTVPYMNYEKFKNEYLPQFDEAEKKYGDKIKIYRGLEIEYLPGYDDLYRKLLRDADYLILGEHVYLCDGKICNSFADKDDLSGAIAYFDAVMQGVKSGYFSILAHPDLIFFNNLKPDERVLRKLEDTIECCTKNGVKVEINGQGARANGFGYPTDYLVEICKKLNAPVVVSADCHSPEALCDTVVKKLYAVAKKAGLNISADGFIHKKQRT